MREKSKKIEKIIVVFDECIPPDAKKLVKEKWNIEEAMTIKDLGLKGKEDKEIITVLQDYFNAKKIFFTGDKKGFKRWIDQQLILIRFGSKLSQERKEKKIEVLKKFLDNVSLTSITKGVREITIESSKKIHKRFRTGHTTEYKF